MPPPLRLSAPGSAPDAAPFRWGDVAAPDRDWLRRRTEDVGTFSYRIGCDYVRLGVILGEVRGRLRHGTYLAWLAAETPFTPAHAKRLRAVGHAFGEYVAQMAQIEPFAPSALYLLAQPQVPAQVREYAVELAAEGKPVTRADAQEMIAATRARVFASKAEAAAAIKAHDATMREVRQAEGATRADHNAAVRLDAARLAKLAAALLALVRDCTLVHITTVDDTEGDDPQYSVTVHREHDVPRCAVRADLTEALESAGGWEREKRCPGCRAVKKLSAFAYDRTTADGHVGRCRMCEGGRVSASKKKRVRDRQTRARGAEPEPGARPAA